MAKRDRTQHFVFKVGDKHYGFDYPDKRSGLEIKTDGLIDDATSDMNETDTEIEDIIENAIDLIKNSDCTLEQILTDLIEQVVDLVHDIEKKK